MKLLNRRLLLELLHPVCDATEINTPLSLKSRGALSRSLIGLLNVACRLVQISLQIF